MIHNKTAMLQPLQGINCILSSCCINVNWIYLFNLNWVSFSLAHSLTQSLTHTAHFTHNHVSHNNTNIFLLYLWGPSNDYNDSVSTSTWRSMIVSHQTLREIRDQFHLLVFSFIIFWTIVCFAQFPGALSLHLVFARYAKSCLMIVRQNLQL